MKEMSTREWLVDHILSYSKRETLIANCVKQQKVSRKTVLKRLRELEDLEPEDIKTYYSDISVENQIKLGLLILDNRLIRAIDFRDELDINERRWRKVKRTDIFDDCRIFLKGNELWGMPNTIKKLKKELNL